MHILCAGAGTWRYTRCSDLKWLFLFSLFSLLYHGVILFNLFWTQQPKENKYSSIIFLGTQSNLFEIWGKVHIFYLSDYFLSCCFRTALKHISPCSNASCCRDEHFVLRPIIRPTQSRYNLMIPFLMCLNCKIWLCVKRPMSDFLHRWPTSCLSKPD